MKRKRTLESSLPAPMVELRQTGAIEASNLYGTLSVNRHPDDTVDPAAVTIDNCRVEGDVEALVVEGNLGDRVDVTLCDLLAHDRVVQALGAATFISGSKFAPAGASGTRSGAAGIE